MEEIGIKDLIRIALRGKYIISLFTIVCMVISIIISFFILDPEYEAQTMLMISPILNSETQSKDNNFTELVGNLSQYPQMTVDTYREQVKSPVILQYIREQIYTKDKSLNSIADMISVNAIKNTNLINICVKSNNSEEATNIANLLSQRFTEFVSETNKKQAENSAQFIKEQMEKEETDLNVSSEKLKEFLSKPRGPEELKLEVDSKLKQLTEYKTQIAQIKIDVEVTRTSLLHGKELLKNTPVKLVTSKTVIDDKLLGDIIKEQTGLNTIDMASIKLSDEQINDIYITLANSVNALDMQHSTLVSQLANIEEQIKNRQVEIESLQAELAQKQQEFDILNHEVELIKQTYDAYQQKYKESMIKQSAEIGKSSIVVVSEAIPPIVPIGPRKVLNLALSVAIGLGIGFLIVFLREYLSDSYQKTEKIISL